MEMTTPSKQGGMTQLERFDRVRSHTTLQVNERIDRLAMQRIEEAKKAGPLQLQARLEAVNREWDVDRAVMLNFALVAGSVLAMGLKRIPAKKKMNGWLYFLGVQFAFLANHAIAGWCPPLPVMRRLGLRTSREIEAERRALESALAQSGVA